MQQIQHPHPPQAASNGQHGLSADRSRRVPRVAIYARYSTDGQRETSITDQIRTCQEAAARLGLTVSPDLIFADEAITGAAYATALRGQYHALRDAVRSGQVDVIFCDQQCRLARSAKESLTFFDELKAHDTRLITADGFDSSQPTAQLLFGMKSVFSEFFLDETRHRVQRGLVGQFERGSMVTAIPYGYALDRSTDVTSGCRWQVNEAEATVVREMFAHRKAGATFSQIAAILNGRGVPTPGSKTVRGGQYWRASALWRILQNPIYKGLYVVNFGKKPAGEAASGTCLVAELALVTPDEWEACQRVGRRNGGGATGVAVEQRSYGGGRHALAGVFRCGVCGASLTVHHGKRLETGNLHCAQCAHATSDGVAGRQPLYVSLPGVKVMLRWLLERVIAGEAMQSFHEALRAKLDGGQVNALAEARQALEKAQRAQQRLGRLLHEVDCDDGVLEQQYLAARENVLRLEAQVRTLTDGVQRLNQEAIAQQLTVDLSRVVEQFLSDSESPARTRTVLQRVFPSIVLVGKPERFAAIFEVTASPGAIVAAASGTAEVATDISTKFRLLLRTSGARNPTWSVEQLD